MVIYDGEIIIGTKENIWRFFKEEIVKEIQDNTIDFEIIKRNINDMLDVMNQIQYDNRIETDTLIKINEHPMGGFVYKVCKEMD